MSVLVTKGKALFALNRLSAELSSGCLYNLQLSGMKGSTEWAVKVINIEMRQL